MALNRKRSHSDFVSEDEIVAILEGAPKARGPGSFTEHELDSDKVQRTLKYLFEKWTLTPDSSESMANVAAERFGVLEQFEKRELVPFGENGLKKIYTKKQLCLVRLRYHFVRLGIMELTDSFSSDVVGTASKSMFTRCHECMHRLFETLMMTLLTLKCLDPMWSRDCPSGDDPYNIKPFDPHKLSMNQQFLVFVLENAQKLGLRRYKKACYIEIESPGILIDGKLKTFKTHAWKRYMDIAEFVNKCAPKETHLTMWQASVDGPAKSRAIDELEKGFDMQFPVLEPDRFYHAFYNGIYDVQQKKFFSWGSSDIGPQIVCCKYHEKQFDESIISLKNWRDIPTPSFDKILLAQLNHYQHVELEKHEIAGTKKFVPKKWTEETAKIENDKWHQARINVARKNGWTDEEIEDGIHYEKRAIPGSYITTPEGKSIIDWVYIEGGRLLYPVNYLDTWQHMPMFIGRAGTGKSLILSTWAKFFDDADVATIANDIQAGFGLETVYNAFVWMIKEVKHDLKLEQSQLQSMITGEEMSIARKNMPALQIVWKAPGVMAGNELANWTDNSGSMSRRLLLFYFRKFVPNSDPKLAQKLADEIPNLIHKSNMAYAEACELYGHCDLWGYKPELVKKFEENPELEALHTGPLTILPSYFHNNKSSFKAQTHLMENFLRTADELVVLGKEKGLGMPFENDHEGRPSFKNFATAFFKKQDAKSFTWSKTDRYMSTLEDFNLEVRKLTDSDNRNYCGMEYPVGTNWIFGVIPRKEAELMEIV